MSQTLASSTRSRSRTSPAVQPSLRPAPAARSTLRGPARVAAGAAARTTARTVAGSPLRSPLRAVAAPVSDRSRTAFVLGCLVLLVGGLFALLMININLAEGSFRLQQLQATSSRLADGSQALTEDIAQQASPEQLSVRAAALGMVPSGSVAFLRLSDGRVLGVAKPAPRPTSSTVQAPGTQPGGGPGTGGTSGNTGTGNSRTTDTTRTATQQTEPSTTTR